MPPSYNRIPPIERIPENIEDVIESVNARIDEINQVLAEIAVADSSLRGQDNFEPAFFNRVNMRRNRITNAERSRDPRDVVTRIELEEIGILGDTAGVSFTGPVNFEVTPTSSGAASGGSNSLSPTFEINANINAAVEAASAVARSGEFVDERELGVNGTTQGTLLMGVDGQGRAAFGRLFNGAQMVSDPCANALLVLILQELRKLNNATNSGSTL